MLAFFIVICQLMKFYSVKELLPLSGFALFNKLASLNINWARIAFI